MVARKHSQSFQNPQKSRMFSSMNDFQYMVFSPLRKCALHEVMSCTQAPPTPLTLLDFDVKHRVKIDGLTFKNATCLVAVACLLYASSYINYDTHASYINLATYQNPSSEFILLASRGSGEAPLPYGLLDPTLGASSCLLPIICWSQAASLSYLLYVEVCFPFLLFCLSQGVLASLHHQWNQ